ncbi:MAG: transposase [Opitutaceae bacterium]|jgi:putative transposase|nr:transposase [Opitutaceae bacterium]
MRQARIKVDANEGQAVYHCMTRTVNGERLFDDVAKEILRKQLWQIADYCGLEIITYAIMANHFHVLVRVPQKPPLTDAELIRRYRVLYPKPTKYQTARFEVIQTLLKSNHPEAIAWRDRQLAMMGDLSPFMKLVKQRFSVWYNRTHQRYGTLWAERFKSVLVEAKAGVMRTMAAYIDLNAVRAGLVDDPKDYRFCGYAEAVAGRKFAQEGIVQLVEGGRAHHWKWTQSAYRETLFGKGSAPREHKANIDAAELEKVIKSNGQLPLHQVLRCRVRYFTDGAVLGGHSFVQEHLGTYQKLTGTRSRTAPRPIPRVADWGDLTTLRGLRRKAFGT